MSGRFSDNFRDAIAYSRDLAIEHQHGFIDIAHFVIVLLDNDEEYAEGMMKSLGVDPLELRTSIEQAILSTIPKQKIDAKSSIPLTVRAEEVLKFAVAEAENTLKTSEVEVHHFWLSILKHSDGTTWAMVGSEKVNYNQYLKAIWARKKLYDHLIVSDGPKENHTTWLKQKLGLK